MSYQKFKGIKESIKARFDRNERLGENYTEFRYCENLFEISREYSDLTDMLLDYIKEQEQEEPIKLSDKDLVLQLKYLLDLADDLAWNWRSNEGKDKTQEEYEDYRNWVCFKSIWDKFWEIENQIEVDPSNDYDPDAGYEDDMRARFDAYQWLLEE